MSFVIDLVSEDSFYINLFLGLYKLLNKHPLITDIKLKREQPCEKSLITSWEQKHSISLPNDMKQFYMAVDGVKLTWSFKYSEEKIMPVGDIQIRPLTEITLLSLPQYDPAYPTKPMLLNSEKDPMLNTHSRLFELDSIKDDSKIVLFYSTSDSEPSIWIIYKNYKWSYLADNFTKYFRTMLVHHGLPQWQHCFTSRGLPTWVEELYMMVAPHLLRPYKRQNKLSNENYIPELPHNHIDPMIFTSDAQIMQRRYKNSK